MSELWSVTVPSWLTGAGTLGLAGFAFAQVRGARTDAATRYDQEQHARASLIAGWVLNPNEKRTAIVLENNSGGPVYDVDAYICARGTDDDGNLTDELTVRRTRIILIPPGRWYGYVAGPFGFPKPERNSTAGTPVGLAITFRDSSGRRWLRHHEGAITEAPDTVAIYSGVEDRKFLGWDLSKEVRN
ncbi:hypothetical protein [Allobranchiibius sp. GilTou73]|uniref:hypothetical protein n=1 Tax=Allobranchiibius sp. GilTou73 TaxID=2904523 RepID=UPI001F41A236|nr:hypothetical protein [Allobranchiibius sp. GilTou73]UIJ33373.1 hypothetical protein LVQ62_09230 [Allobranchiibius sp. GilTou73]